MASSGSFCVRASHPRLVDIRGRSPNSSETLRDTHLNTSQTPFNYFERNIIRLPFKRLKKWKRKYKNEGRNKQLSIRKRNFLRFAPSWTRASKWKRTDREADTALITDFTTNLPEEKAVQSAKLGKGLRVKGYFKSLFRTPKILDSSQFGSSTWLTRSYSLSLRDADSSASSPNGKSDCSTLISNSANSCPYFSSLADCDQSYTPKLQRWGYWSDLKDPNGEAQPKEEFQQNVKSHRWGKFCVDGKFLKLKGLNWHMNGSKIKERQSQMVVGPACNDDKELETFHLEERLKEKSNRASHFENWIPELFFENRATVDIKVFGKVRHIKEQLTMDASGCFGGRKLSRTPKGKRNVQNEQSDEDSKCSTAPTYPQECDKHYVGCIEVPCERKITSTHISQSRAVDLEELFSGLIGSTKKPIMQGTGGAGGSFCKGTPGLKTYRSRSGNAPEMPSSRCDDSLMSLHAKMESRFEQVFEAIDTVADEVRRSVKHQQQKVSLEDDTDKFDQSRLISSKSIDLDTGDMESLPLKDWVPQSEPLKLPVANEFKEALDNAHFKMRVLAGLLTVEKDAKLASANNFQPKNMILSMGMIGTQMLEGETLLEKPWHIKYVLDCCISSIFFNGPHGSSNCICYKPRPAHINCNGCDYNSFCNGIELSSMTFDSLRDDASLAIEEVVGIRTQDWSEALTNTFWSCAVSCFHVHNIIEAIIKVKAKIQILHAGRNMNFESSAMDPLDTGNFKAFHKKVHFTIFSGFMVEGKVLYKSQVYLEPKVALIRL